MDDLDTAIFVYSAIRVLRKKKRANRRWWVHPINSERLLSGTFYNLYNMLRADNEKFFNYFRMSQSTFDELFNKIKSKIMRQDTVMRSAIPAEEMLAVTLRYLGSTNSLQDLHYEYRIGRSTLCGIIRRVCSQIWEVMHNECIPTPNEEKWLEIAEGYQQRAQFPNCIGAIDGKHIRVIKPHGSGSHYFNYKHFFSVVLLAVVDSNYCFTFIDVGSFGKDSDPTIFKNSTLYKKLQNDSLNIPKPNLIRGIQIPMPYAFVGDEAFGLSTNMLRPYAGKCLPINKRIFNYRLSRARRYVECAFGILSNKWRIFHRAIDVDIELAIDIVKCCCVLHNYFVHACDGYEFEDSLMVTGMDDIELDNNLNVNRSINRYRDALTNYFNSELGQVAWQNEKI
ncbi:protein ALP1-like [Melanaphis sacchari]|uniref:protein ALP1-like n=1 Tax=Melanaphis sacchari TaxID=742174 RepID=UPI000DC143B4|nr:protein ALP1-like [Melanaphis sacchari]